MPFPIIPVAIIAVAAIAASGRKRTTEYWTLNMGIG